jgi:hypothetical protein
MDIDVKKIVSAWMTSFSPNDDEKKLAEDRYNICSTCDRKEKNLLGIDVCKECGCPLSKKIFTLTDKETCPLKKWDDLDSEFRKNKKHKYNLF